MLSASLITLLFPSGRHLVVASTHTHFSFALIFTNIFLRVWYFRSCSDWDCLPILDISRLPIVEEFASMKITLKTLQQDTFHVEIDDTENVRVCARVLRSNF